MECRTATNQTPLDLAITSQMKELLLSFTERPSSQSCSQGKKKNKEIRRTCFQGKTENQRKWELFFSRNQKKSEMVKTVLNIKQEIMGNGKLFR